MNELFTFETNDKRFKFTVKAEFRTRCSNAHEMDVYDLMTKHQLASFLHNPGGPAIIHNVDGIMEYWLNGKKVSKEEGEKMAHNFQFNNELLTEINKE